MMGHGQGHGSSVIELGRAVGDVVGWAVSTWSMDVVVEDGNDWGMKRAAGGCESVGWWDLRVESVEMGRGKGSGCNEGDRHSTVMMLLLLLMLISWQGSVQCFFYRKNRRPNRQTPACVLTVENQMRGKERDFCIVRAVSKSRLIPLTY